MSTLGGGEIQRGCFLHPFMTDEPSDPTSFQPPPLLTYISCPIRPHLCTCSVGLRRQRKTATAGRALSTFTKWVEIAQSHIRGLDMLNSN